MRIEQLLLELKAQQIKVSLNQGKLRIAAPKGGISDELKVLLKDNKDKILAYLQKNSASGQDYQPIEAISKIDVSNSPTPLSFAQQRLWFIDKLQGSSAQYNMSTALHIVGDFHFVAAEQAIKTIIERHHSLRTQFVSEGENTWQQVKSSIDFSLKLKDLTKVDHQDIEQLVNDCVIENNQQVFDLSSGLLVRAMFIQLPPLKEKAQGVLSFNLHHIATDGWSMGLMVKEFCSLYRAYLFDKHNFTSCLTPLPVQYGDYARWQHQWLKGDSFEQHMAYWLKQLNGIPQTHSLPLDRPRPKVQSYKGANYQSKLDSNVASRLSELCQENGATLFMGLHSVFSVLMARLSNETDIVIGTPVANREQTEIAQLIGFFVNTLVLRSDLSNHAISFNQLLNQGKKTLLEAYARQQVPFEQLVERLQPQRTLRHSPLFQVLLVLQNNKRQILELPGLTIKPYEYQSQSAKFDLTLNVELDEQGAGLTFDWEYNTDIFFGSTIVNISEQFNRLVQGLVDNPDSSVFQVPMLSEAARQQQIVQFNQNDFEFDRSLGLHQLFEAQADSNDAIAIISGDEQLSYRQLNQRANKLARAIIKNYQQQNNKPLTADSIITLFTERSIDLVVAVLAVLKTGACYLPIDVLFPTERISYILSDSGSAMVITQHHLFEKVVTIADLSSQDVQVLNINDPDLIVDVADNDLNVNVDSSDLACVLYTSGTTGKPKGVMLPHLAVTNRIMWMAESYDISDKDRWLIKTPYTFDVSLFEMFWPLKVGGTLVIIEPEGHKDPRRIDELLRLHQINACHFVPSMLSVYCEYLTSVNMSLPETLDTVFCSGEALTAKHVNEFNKLRGKDYKGNARGLINFYGPTETGEATWYNCPDFNTEDLTPFDGVVPIGSAVGNFQLYVLNSARELAPFGSVGELYIGGAGVARGYLNQPQLTAERFIESPFISPQLQAQGFTRLYKTGDRVRWLPSMELEYLGRSDFQLKIRGNRIELSEIEALILKLNEIHQVVVTDFQPQGDASAAILLVAYIVMVDGNEFDKNKVSDYVAEHLPDYMIPSAWVQLPQLPLTANGKVNRGLLPAPDMSSKQSDYLAPRNEIEQILCDVWQEVLGIDRVGVQDNFFALGGHSLSASKVMVRASKKLEIEVPLKLLFTHQTIESLAASLAQMSKGLCQPPLVLRAKQYQLQAPSSFAQQRLWLLDQLEGSSSQYNMPSALKLTGKLDVDVLNRAFTTIITRHESLRSVFDKGADGIPIQIINAAQPIKVTLHDWSEMAVETQQSLLGQLLAEHARYHFDLTKDLMLQLKLVKLSSKQHVLLFNMHHIASDGWSMGILINEFCALYRAYSQNEDNPLAPLPLQYADYALWQRQWLQGHVLEQKLSYWTKQLADLPTVHSLPLDYPRPTVQTYNGESHYCELSRSLTEQIEAMCLEHGATLFMALQSVFSVLIARYSNETDIVIGSPVANRDQAEIADLIGFFVNTLVLRSDVSQNPKFVQLLAQNKQMLLDGYANQAVPFEQLVEQLQPERSLSHSPLFQIMMVMQNNEQGQLQLPDLTLSNIDGQVSVAKYELNLSIALLEDAQQGSRLAFNWVYNTDCFARSSIERMARHFELLLSAFVNDPQQKVLSVDMLSANERYQQLELWNDTKQEGLSTQTIDQMFSQHASNTPDAVALVYCDDEGNEQKLSYAQLERKANDLAGRLRTAQIISADTLIGVCCEPSLELVIAILAILKAGAAYVPLDSNFPSGRLKGMIEDAQLAIVITSEKIKQQVLNPLVGDSVQLLTCAQVNDNTVDITSVSPSIDDLAYVIYTSGSTGKPKGVMIEHRQISAHLSRQKELLGIGADEVFILLANPIFDASVEQIFLPLISGARVVLVSKDTIKNPQRLKLRLTQQQVTHLHATPAYLEVLQDLPQDHVIRRVMSGGDVLTANLRQRFGDLLINRYGPTETTITCIEHTQFVDGEPLNTIGKPLANSYVRVLNEANQLVPQGVVGQLHVGGAGVARGYLGQAELTTERFISDPFIDDAQARLYKTGDLVKWQSNGLLEFVSRCDEQVKVRGFRIELAEIEQQLIKLPGVDGALVIAKSYNQPDVQLDDKRLIGYIVCKDSDKLNASVEDAQQNKQANCLYQERVEHIRQQLSQQLPDYMLPSALVFLPQLPLTVNGKVDKRALPEPDLYSNKANYLEPYTNTQKQLSMLWQKLLGVEKVGLNDNFFALGGHSLLVVRLSSLAQEQGIHLNARQVLGTANLGALADAVENAADQEQQVYTVPANQIVAGCKQITPQMLPLITLTQDEITAISAQVSGEIQDIYPLGPLQQGIFYHHVINEGHVNQGNGTEVDGENQNNDPYILNAILAVNSPQALQQLQQALQVIINRHDVLRTAIIWQELENPVQVVLRQAQLKVNQVTSKNAELLTKDEGLQMLQSRPLWMSLSEAPLLALNVLPVRTDNCEQNYLVQLIYHHIISDHVTLELIQKEMQQIRAGLTEQLPVPLGYREFIGHTLHTQKNHDPDKFFSQLLGDFEQPTLPFGLVDIQSDGRNIAQAQQLVPQQLSDAIVNLSKSLEISPAVLFHAAWAMVVAGCSDSQDVVFGSVMSGRLEGVEGAADMMGLFINTLPVRVKLTSMSVNEFIRHVQSVLKDLISYEQVSLASAQRCSAIQAGMPLFSALLNYRHTDASSDDGYFISQSTTDRASEAIEVISIEERNNYPFALAVDRLQDGFAVTMKIDNRYDGLQIIEHLLTCLNHLVEVSAGSQASVTPICKLPILSDPQRQQQLVKWNDTYVPYCQDSNVVELFEKQAALTPDAVAVRVRLATGEVQQLSYMQLNLRANEVASYLLNKGIHQEHDDHLIGICVERSVELMIGIFGILKAGCAYVPLNPSLPPSRLAYMIEDAKIATVLSVADFKDVLPKGDNLVCLFEDLSDFTLQTTDFSGVKASLDDLAYVIYTSGTTGQPKGVEVQHRALLDYCLYAKRSYYQDDLDGSLVATSPSFDMTIPGLYVPVLNGGCVELLPEGDELTVLAQRLTDDDKQCLMRMTPMHVSGLLTILAKQFTSNARHVFVIGGEVFDAALAIKLQQVFPQAQIFNHYGPTEATVGCSIFDVSANIANDQHLSGPLSIGQPMDNTRIYVIDSQGRLAPKGATGQLFVGGSCLARGYLNQVALTEQKFINNPFYDATDPYSPPRLYATGDLVRWHESRQDNKPYLLYSGRIDHQVKIRGFRIELGEIVQQLKTHSEVKDAVVVAHTNSRGDKSLVAYVVTNEPKQDIKALSAQLRQHCAEQLPDYMIPALFLRLEKLPLNTNGKVDLNALPAVDISQQLSTYVAPKTTTECILADIWQQILDIEQVGTQDNFFELGGHSLLLIQMIAMASKQGVQITARQVFTSGQLGELARLADQQSKCEQFTAPDNLIPANCDAITPQMLPLITLTQEQLDVVVGQIPNGSINIQDIYPLGPLQQGILFHHMMGEGHDPYTRRMLLRVNGIKAVEHLQQLLQILIDRHDVLRTAMIWQGIDTPVQVVVRQAQLPINWLDAQALGLQDERQMLQYMQQQNVWIDLSKAPLLSFDAVKVGEQYLVQLILHHIITDHVAMGVVQQELQMIEAGLSDQLLKPAPYREFIAHTEHLARQHDAQSFFGELLGDFEEISAPFGLTNVTGNGLGIVQQIVDVPESICGQIVALSKQIKISPAVIFHSAWAMVIAATSGRDDVVFGTVMSGRLQGLNESQTMLGTFINTLPVRVRFAEQTARSLVEQVRDRLFDIVPYEQAPLSQVQQCSGVGGALFSAIFNYRHASSIQDHDPQNVQTINDDIEFIQTQGGTNYPFNLSVDDFGERFSLDIKVDESIECARVVNYMQTALASLVDALSSVDVNVLDDHSLPIKELNVLPLSEQQQLLEQFGCGPDLNFEQELKRIIANEHQVNACETAENGLSLHQWFADMARQSPDNVALVYCQQTGQLDDPHNLINRELTYAQLDQKANQLAHYLVEQFGFNQQSPMDFEHQPLIGVCIERSVNMIVALLAVLKLGGAYVPLDPSLPKGRLTTILQEAQINHVVSHQAFKEKIEQASDNGSIAVIALDEIQSQLNNIVVEPKVLPKVTSEHLAYIIYTSGSTGKPKGVMIEHRQIVSHLMAQRQQLSITRDEVFILLANYIFDSSVEQIFLPLVTGAKLVVTEQQMLQSPEQIKSCLQQLKVTNLHATPAYLSAIGDLPVNNSIRRFMTGGDVITPDLRKRFGEKLINRYGPTETTVICLQHMHSVSGEPLNTIGKPVAHTQALVLSPIGQLVPVGVAGELYIGGTGVARGYLNQPRLTEQQFIAHPYDSNKRLYKTGDLVKWQENGQLEFIGRIDSQVKIRGLRIELGEIEICLTEHESVNTCMVLAQDTANGDKQLVAYVNAEQTDDTTADNEEQLRSYLAAQLPEYMLPTAYVFIDQWPLTANGKVDRKALPSPQLDIGENYLAPQNEDEQILVNIWADLLKLEPQTISMNANFFALGGHSLLLMRLITQIREQLKIEFSVKQLFESRNLTQLAQLVAAEKQHNMHQQTVFDDEDELEEGELELTL